MLRVSTRLTRQTAGHRLSLGEVSVATVPLKLETCHREKQGGDVFLCWRSEVREPVYTESRVDEVENVYLPFPGSKQYARKTPRKGVFLLFPLGGIQTTVANSERINGN
jgi:hypothetical protein